jgi:hypothetical protein
MAMPQKRRSFKRPLGERRYRKMYVIAVEGAKTEPQYFFLLNNLQAVIHVACLRDKHDSSPPQVWGRMTKYLRDQSLRNSDEAWLVVDKDHWTDPQLLELYQWAQKANNYGFALSNPNFEYWLLLHFEDATGISGAHDCSNRLRNHLPNYDKGIDARKISRTMIENAISRAAARDNPQCEDWPRNIGTTVYRLVRKILET